MCVITESVGGGMFAIIRELIGRKVVRYVYGSDKDPEQQYIRLITRVASYATIVTIFAIGITGRFVSLQMEARVINTSFRTIDEHIFQQQENINHLFNINKDQQKLVFRLNAENELLKKDMVIIVSDNERLSKENKVLTIELDKNCRREELD
ncbi:hypothetical protein CF8_0208 [Aeromonas phage CF8]|nr:hypothetical protein CF8_0208 [Aeromonas phage CF8]